MPVKKLCQGRAIWAVISRNGVNPKRRPGIILTDAREIEAGKPIYIVVTSTDMTPSRGTTEADIIALPFDPQGRIAPGFREPCAAICDWIEEVDPAMILERGGILPRRFLEAIVKRRAEIESGKELESPESPTQGEETP
jgi:hypothetical protein